MRVHGGAIHRRHHEVCHAVVERRGGVEILWQMVRQGDFLDAGALQRKEMARNARGRSKGVWNAVCGRCAQEDVGT